MPPAACRPYHKCHRVPCAPLPSTKAACPHHLLPAPSPPSRTKAPCPRCCRAGARSPSFSPSFYTKCIFYICAVCRQTTQMTNVATSRTPRGQVPHASGTQSAGNDPEARRDATSVPQVLQAPDPAQGILCMMTGCYASVSAAPFSLTLVPLTRGVRSPFRLDWSRWLNSPASLSRQGHGEAGALAARPNLRPPVPPARLSHCQSTARSCAGPPSTTRFVFPGGRHVRALVHPSMTRLCLHAFYVPLPVPFQPFKLWRDGASNPPASEASALHSAPELRGKDIGFLLSFVASAPACS